MPDLPAPRTYRDVPLIPPVDPDDLKRVWNIKPPWKANSAEQACCPGANVAAVVSRRHMLDMLVNFKLLAPWTREDQLDDAVFRLAAAFPLHEQQDSDYQIPGDEYWPFDPSAFVHRLVEETGIAHVWEPVATKVAEGGRGYVTVSAKIRGAVSDPDHEARYKARQLLWSIWSRFSGHEQLLSRPDVESIRLSASLFADFLIANADLVQRVTDECRRPPGAVGLETLMEIEQRAIKRI
ncbi:MAG TPA: hypothetical protein VK466_01960 [Terriglobales bacterium]|nr:hypothetical protein [Terriglobales bacterium]